MNHHHARLPLRLALLGGTALFAAIVAPDAAFAADAAIEDVTVRGRAQSPAAQAAENKPQAASVIGQQQVQDIAATKLVDLAGISPGIVIQNNTPSTNNISVYLRGIGEPDAQGVPSVGIFVDGIYQPRNLGANLDLLGLQDVTIERGPVGFEGGHDAEGGAVRLTTLTPGNTPTLSVQGGYGSYNEYLASVIASGPIVPDLLYGSLAVQRHAHDGIDSNAVTGQKTNDGDTTTVRGKLRLVPNDRFEATLGYDFLFDDSQVTSYGNPTNPDRYTSYNPLVPKAWFQQAGVNLTLDYHLTDEVKLTSITSVRGFFQYAIFDNSPDPYARTSQPLRYRDRSYEQDFRLTGTYDRVDLIAGLYAFHEDWQTDRRSNSAVNYPSDTSKIFYTPVDTSIFQRNTELAAYTETKLHFTPQLTATFGLRADYQQHSNEQSLWSLLPGAVAGKSATQQLTVASLGGLPDVATLLSAPRGPLLWTTTGGIQKDWFQVLPKAALEYAFEPNLRTYASISQGQKEGGYDFRAITPAAQLQAQLPYNPENVTTAEIGLKTKLFDDRVQFNTAAFYNYITNLQATFLDPTSNLAHRFNIGNAHTEGVEAEVIARPLDDWSLHLAATALDAQLDSYKGTVTSHNYGNGYNIYTSPYPGAQLPYTPHFTGSVGSSYILPLPVPGVFRVFGDAVLSSTEYSDLTNIVQQQIPGNIVVNGGLSYTSADGRWNATFTVRNLTDHRYPNSTGYTVISSGSPASIGKPAYVSTYWAPPLEAFFVLRYTL